MGSNRSSHRKVLRWLSARQDPEQLENHVFQKLKTDFLRFQDDSKHNVCIIILYTVTVGQAMPDRKSPSPTKIEKLLRALLKAGFQRLLKFLEHLRKATF